MEVHTLPSLASIDAREWNRIAGDNPFLRHEFLYALERTGCVGPGTGWEPAYVVARRRADGALLGAVPLYVKEHSYGEYVFDWAWADAYRRHGRAYYPKLVAAVPFTPVAGPRLLVAPEADRRVVAERLIEGVRAAADAVRASSVHWLFHSPEEREILGASGHLARVGCQFHWSNPGYRDFSDFLASFTSHKRNNVKRERRQVREAGVRCEVVPGTAVTAALWSTLYRFYRATVRAHGGIAYLTRDFFFALGEIMASQVVLVVARRGERIAGAALCLRNAHTLYGRYWGGERDIPCLHFETCYYAPIEYCIAEGIRRYEAGAQGEHKLARGFTPTPTHSSHWLRDPAFHRAVGEFLAAEQEHVGYYMDELNEHAPYRRSPMPGSR